MSNIWTAVSREIYETQLVAVGFIDDNNVHIRVPFENLENFFNNNYITNIILDTVIGDIKGYGIDIECLDTYKCTKTGRCIFKPGVGEYQILQMASKTTKKIKNEKSKQETREAIQEKREDAAKKLAIAATIIGVTATGVKSISKTVEVQDYRNLKKTVYNKLKRYNKLLEQIIEAKHRTNRLISLDKSIVRYNRKLESNNIRNKELRVDIVTYGIPQYLKNIQTLVNVCMTPINKFNLTDESLREFGAETTLRLYRASLDNNILKIKQLHIETKRLLQDNLDNKPDGKDSEHILAVESSIKKIEQSLPKDIGKLSEQMLIDKIRVINDIELTPIRILVENIQNENIKGEYYDYLYCLDTMLIELRQTLSTELRKFIDIHKKEVEQSLKEVELMLSDIKNESYATKEIQGMYEFILNEMGSIKNKINELSLDIQEDLFNKHNKVMESINEVQQILKDKETL